MKILSIHDGHNASAALFDGQEVLSAVSEERINREKFFWGWPEESIKYVLDAGGIKLEDVDVVSVSHLDTLSYLRRKLEKKSFFSPPKIFLGHILNTLTAFKREMKVRVSLRGGRKKEYFFCDHHLAHAASAYYFSGFKNSLVLTCDGLGDSLSHTAWSVKDGEWKKLLEGGSEASLGAFYGALTEGLGFRSNRHEGKVVGLAAMGDVDKVPRFPFVSLSKDKLFFQRKPYYEMVSKVKEWLKEGYAREDIAAYGQNLLETLVIQHTQELCKITGMKNLALAGGVFSNVKLNQKIVEQCSIDKIFIQPAMGDEGLVLGSATYYFHQNTKNKLPEEMRDVYLGHGYSDEEIEDCLQKGKYSYERVDDASILVAKALSEEKIVGWFDGRMEFGPRALGHRTMMAHPGRKEINAELNKRLHRSEFMPFAPSVLIEDSEEIFENLNPSSHTAEFMTITVNVKEDWRKRIAAVVHVDNTARPQLVRENRNPSYYAAIQEFKKITGIPLIVNTSFNMHEEPIVCSPSDALRSFDEGAVDLLVFNNKFLVLSPRL